MRPIDRCFPDSDPEAIRKAYILGYRAGYQHGKCRYPDATRSDYDAENLRTIPIEAMKLSVHAYNCLLRYGYRCVSDVTKAPARTIRSMRGMGKVTAMEIVQVLKEYGIADTEWEFAWLTD